MARRCEVCIHRKLEAINEALIDGERHRPMAEKFGVSRHSIRRHATNHLPVLLAETAAAGRFSQAESLADRVEQLSEEARRIKGRAEAAGDLRTALASVRELVRIAELLAKLQGELDDRPAINIAVIPEWRIVLKVLDAHPEARVEVARALEAAQ